MSSKKVGSRSIADAVEVHAINMSISSSTEYLISPSLYTDYYISAEPSIDRNLTLTDSSTTAVRFSFVSQNLDTFNICTTSLGPASLCLDVFGNNASQPHLATPGDYSGQFWTVKITNNGSSWTLQNGYSGQNLWLGAQGAGDIATGVYMMPESDADTWLLIGNTASQPTATSISASQLTTTASQSTTTASQSTTTASQSTATGSQSTAITTSQSTATATGSSTMSSSTPTSPLPTTNPSSVPTSTPASQAQTSNSALSTGAAVGIALGAVGLIVLLVIAWLIYRRQKQQQKQQQRQPPVYEPQTTNEKRLGPLTPVEVEAVEEPRYELYSDAIANANARTTQFGAQAVADRNELP
jgi:hypothetical protein